MTLSNIWRDIIRKRDQIKREWYKKKNNGWFSFICLCVIYGNQFVWLANQIKGFILPTFRMPDNIFCDAEQMVRFYSFHLPPTIIPNNHLYSHFPIPLWDMFLFTNLTMLYYFTSISLSILFSWNHICVHCDLVYNTNLYFYWKKSINVFYFCVSRNLQLTMPRKSKVISFQFVPHIPRNFGWI